MKKIVFGFMCYFLYAVAHAQEEPPSKNLVVIPDLSCKISWFLPIEQASATERSTYIASLIHHAEVLAGKKQKIKNEKRFLAKMFHKTHKNHYFDTFADSIFYYIFRLVHCNNQNQFGKSAHIASCRKTLL